MSRKKAPKESDTSQESSSWLPCARAVVVALLACGLTFAGLSSNPVALPPGGSPADVVGAPPTGASDQVPKDEPSEGSSSPDGKRAPPKSVDPRRASLVFVNDAPEAVNLLWDAETGAEPQLLIEGIQPGGSRSANGFEGHLYVWQNRGGTRRFGTVRAQSGEQTIHLTADMYHRDGVPITPKPKDGPPCVDRAAAAQCVPMMSKGFCGSAPGWMAVNCAKTCDMCGMRFSSIRCALDRFNQTDALPQGETLDDLFERVLSRTEFSPTAHSRPPAGPWVVTLEDFITDAEIAALMHHSETNLRRSTDQGAVDPTTGEVAKVVSSKRTSSNSWCLGNCEADPMVQQLTARIADVTGIESTH